MKAWEFQIAAIPRKFYGTPRPSIDRDFIIDDMPSYLHVMEVKQYYNAEEKAEVEHALSSCFENASHDPSMDEKTLFNKHVWENYLLITDYFLLSLDMRNFDFTLLFRFLNICKKNSLLIVVNGTGEIHDPNSSALIKAIFDHAAEYTSIAHNI